MNTIGICALVLSVINFAWAIYKELALRARVRVNFAIGRGNLPGRPILPIVTVTNLGPGQVWIGGTTLDVPKRIRGSFPVEAYVSMGPTFDTPLSGQLPAMLTVGQRVTITLPYGPHSFIRHPGVRIGVTDSFGRNHFAPASDTERARQEFEKDFRI